MNTEKPPLLHGGFSSVPLFNFLIACQWRTQQVAIRIRRVLNIIISGHTRLKAARQLGLEEVPCIVQNLSEEDAKLARIIDKDCSHIPSAGL